MSFGGLLSHPCHSPCLNELAGFPECDRYQAIPYSISGQPVVRVGCVSRAAQYLVQEINVENLSRVLGRKLPRNVNQGAST